MFRYEIVYIVPGRKDHTRIVSRESFLETMRSGPYGIRANRSNRYCQQFENAAILGDPSVYAVELPFGTREMRVWKIS